MKTKKGILKILAASVASVALAACGAKLLWSAVLDTGKPLVAITLAVDADNNSYVGGAEREITDAETGAVIFSGLLAKHDAQGNPQWQTSLDGGSSVVDVVVLSEDYLAVLVRALNDSGSSPNDPGPGSLWLVSAADGTFVSELEAFDNFPFRKMTVASGKLYVVKSEIPVGCDFMGCGPSEPKASEITTYDLQGNLLQTRSLGERNLKDAVVDSAGQVYALFYAFPSLLKLDAVLEDVWTVDTDAAHCYGQGLLVGDGGFYVECSDGVLQVSAQGQPGAYTSFESELGWFPADRENAIWAQAWGEGSHGVVAADGDLYIAKARYKIFGPSMQGPTVGPLRLQLASLMESDAVLLKVKGGSGGIAWSDDIHTPLFGDADSVTTYFYYPLGVHLAGDKVRLTYRGFVGDYGGGPENLCADATDVYYFVNACSLLDARERYAKTQDYRAADGKRLTNVRYEVPYPRLVEQDSNGSLLLAGDGMGSLPSTVHEVYTWGWYSDEREPVFQSPIYLQKSKP